MKQLSIFELPSYTPTNSCNAEFPPVHVPPFPVHERESLRQLPTQNSFLPLLNMT